MTERHGEAAPDWILVGGRILTGRAEEPRAEALAIRAGRIVAVGKRAEIEELAGEGTRVEELGGAAVVPGLVDAHGHVLGLGFALRRLDLRGVASYQELVQRVTARAGQQPAGTWIHGRGWDQTLWTPAQFPHHSDLSEAVPDHPVLVKRVDGHAALANAAALRLAGIERSTPDPDGGRILRGANGEPTGVLIDNGATLVERVVSPPSRQEQRDALERAVSHLASLGLTGVHDAGVGYAPTIGLTDPEDPGWATVELYRDLLRAGRLPLRVYVMLGGTDAYPPEDRYFERPPVVGEGDGLLTVRAIKIGVDGALGSRGAALEGAYADEPSQSGLVVRSQETLDRLVRRSFESGWQVAIHAIGDRANRMALDAVAAARRAVPEGTDARPRIEHAQVLRPEDIDRFAEIGVIASVQPTHATSDRRWAETRLGPERIAGAYAYRSLARAGARMACGSDFPVEDADPRGGLRAAVARQDAAGEPPEGWRTEESLTIEEALGCFSAGAAYASFTEHENGQIAPGLRADLTILAEDPSAIEPARLTEIKVLRTVVGGRITYTAETRR
jgi:predicted amidohydrolase YtcJ